MYRCNKGRLFATYGICNPDTTRIPDRHKRNYGNEAKKQYSIGGLIIHKELENKNRNAICKWAYDTSNENENFENIENIVISSRFLQHPETLRREQDMQHIETWASSEDGAMEQHDYIMIEKRHDWVTQVKTKGGATKNSPYQHKMLLLKLRLKIKKDKMNQEGIKHRTHDIFRAQ